jgi:hypothetical protein
MAVKSELFPVTHIERRQLDQHKIDRFIEWHDDQDWTELLNLFRRSHFERPGVIPIAILLLPTAGAGIFGRALVLFFFVLVSLLPLLTADKTHQATLSDKRVRSGQRLAIHLDTQQAKEPRSVFWLNAG